MQLWIGYDVERFAADAKTFLEARIERNVLATVLVAIQSGRYAEAIFAVVSDDRHQTVAAAIRTPPHLMIVAGELPDADAFMQAWLGIDPACPGVSAEPVLAQALAQAWSHTNRGSVELHVHESLMVLQTVTPPEPPVPGELRLADFRDSAQLGDWGVAFAIETGLGHPESAPAAMQHSVRNQGARRCMLYTDLANPISNHVYAKLGYVPVAEWEERRFLSPA